MFYCNLMYKNKVIRPIDDNEINALTFVDQDKNNEYFLYEI